MGGKKLSNGSVLSRDENQERQVPQSVWGKREKTQRIKKTESGGTVRSRWTLQESDR